MPRIACPERPGRCTRARANLLVESGFVRARAHIARLPLEVSLPATTPTPLTPSGLPVEVCVTHFTDVIRARINALTLAHQWTLQYGLETLAWREELCRDQWSRVAKWYFGKLRVVCAAHSDKIRTDAEAAVSAVLDCLKNDRVCNGALSHSQEVLMSSNSNWQINAPFVQAPAPSVVRPLSHWVSRFAGSAERDLMKARNTMLRQCAAVQVTQVVTASAASATEVISAHVFYAGQQAAINVDLQMRAVADQLAPPQAELYKDFAQAVLRQTMNGALSIQAVSQVNLNELVAAQPTFGTR